MNATSWRATINSPAFALAELCIVVISGLALLLIPQIGVWAIAASLVPWGIKAFAGFALFQRNRLDWLVALFVLSAGAGLWASYDQAAALDKFLLIVMSVFLFYALRSQPQENLVWVSVGLFGIGVGVSVYFFLTHDFIASPRKLDVVNLIGRWIMRMRPATGWQAIHPNYVSGIAAITTPYILYAGWVTIKNAARKAIPFLLMASGSGIVLFALFMATSRGVLMAIASAMGVLFLGLLARSNRINFRLGRDAIFPIVVFVFLIVVVALLFIGPAQIGGGVPNLYNFGTGSRAELFSRSAYLIADFPFTGGGLGAFPGLYSRYMLGVPYYNVPNSHNVFLDVFIEQGVIGGISFLALYLAGLWQASRSVVTAESFETNLFGWVTLGTLIIAVVHGAVDDYLYYEKGTILSLALIGVSLSAPRSSLQPGKSLVVEDNWKKPLWFIVGLSFALLFLLNVNRIRSHWYSNLGAVRMAQVELKGFPTGAWAGPELAANLSSAEEALLTALAVDPANPTANYRLGLIATLRRDFPSAATFLELAYLRSPRHRGIVKSLGFSHVWNGEIGLAQPFLAAIPESSDELDSYIWYWTAQGLPVISSYASAMKDKLDSIPVQP
jgi:O-antigen ligase